MVGKGRVSCEGTGACPCGSPGDREDAGALTSTRLTHRQLQLSVSWATGFLAERQSCFVGDEITHRGETSSLNQSNVRRGFLH